MDKVELIKELFEIVILPLLGALTLFVVKWINAQANAIKTKTDDETLQKYIDMLTSTVTHCVIATNQTYVEALKKEGKFDEEAQMHAFELTRDAVLSILSEEAKTYLVTAVGDFEMYLNRLIETEVNIVKNNYNL